MKLALFGDVYLDKKYQVNINLDQFVFNLEYPLVKRGMPAKNKINIGVDKPNIEETFQPLPMAVNLANNHIMDFGTQSFSDTLEHLKSKGIGFFGAGTQDDNHNNPCLINLGKKSVALLGYSCPTTHPIFSDGVSPGSAKLDMGVVTNDIRHSKNISDFIVINVHWGDEDVKYPKPSDVEKAHQMIDAGADLIIGHHAHVIQSMEQYRGKYIFYGLGNFIFPDFEVPSHFDGSMFTKTSAKVQQKVNKESLAVVLDEQLEITFESVFCDGKSIEYTNAKVPLWIPKSRIAYRTYYMYQQRYATLQRFFANPRMPTLRQFKAFFRF